MAKRGAVVPIVACVLAMVLPAPMVWAEIHAAMMYTSGSVLVNGAGVSRTTAIFSGDRLQVPDRSAATITAKGSLVTILPGSAVTFRGDAIALERRSAVSITTTEGMAAQVRTLTIAPAAKANTKFQVVRLNGNITIAAHLGAVVVSDGSEKTTLAEGKSTTVPDPEPQTPPAAATGAALPTTHAVVPVLVGLGATGAAIGTAMETTTKPISADRP